MKRLSLLLLLQLTCYFSAGTCGKVLVWPVEFSHWLNIRTILDELVTRGHEVTVLISSASTITNSSKPSTMKFETFPVSLTKSDYENFIEHLLEKFMYAAKGSFWTYLSAVKKLFTAFFDTAITMCKDAVSNKKLMTKLEESRFDILIADAVGPCGELLAELLKIPFVYSHYTSPGHIIEKNSGRLPFPPSYVPVMFSELSDHMTFMERIKNMLYTLYFDFFFPTSNEKKWNQFYSEALGKLGFLIAQWSIIYLPMQETLVRSFGQEDPLEKERAYNSSVFVWEIPWTEKPVGLQSLGSQNS